MNQRRTPVPIPGRRSNAELQREIDATKELLDSMKSREAAVKPKKSKKKLA